MYEEYGIDPVSTDSAMTLTATIEPAEADEKDVDWSIAWQNPSSAWATGKDIAQYATVVPTSDGALTATVTCKQAFGEPFIVTVTSRYSEELTAECTFDYVKRVTDINLQFSADSLAFDTTYTVTATPVYGVGTVQGDFAEKSYKVALTDDFKSAISAIYAPEKTPSGGEPIIDSYYYDFKPFSGSINADIHICKYIQKNRERKSSYASASGRKGRKSSGKE